MCLNVNCMYIIMLNCCRLSFKTIFQIVWKNCFRTRIYVYCTTRAISYGLAVRCSILAAVSERHFFPFSFDYNSKPRSTFMRLELFVERPGTHRVFMYNSIIKYIHVHATPFSPDYFSKCCVACCATVNPDNRALFIPCIYCAHHQYIYYMR